MQDGKAHGAAFYSAQFARFGSRLAAEIRQEAYGADIGQQGWRTRKEQEEITALARLQPPCHMLDVACGSGGPALAAASAARCRLTGVDIEPEGIAEARRRAAAMGMSGSAGFLAADCNDTLPFDDGAFDLVVCVDAVLHLKDRRAALADWFRLLRPGGRVLMADAAVLTGAVPKPELDIRASQGSFVVVPPGLNEAALAGAGFRLLKCEDTTTAMAETARRLHAARRRRAKGLKREEGAEWFERRQTFLATTAELAEKRRLSRFLYVAEKPAALGEGLAAD
jgi:SAM-dependent methyltransferase